MDPLEPEPILQTQLAVRPWSDPLLARLPGLVPLGEAPLFLRDDAFAAQLALKDRILAARPGATLFLPPEAEEAGAEALGLVLSAVRTDPAYGITPGGPVLRPDGVRVALDGVPPLLAAARLVQPDLVLMAPSPDGHRIAAAALAFPASWRLSDKAGRPMSRVHAPVARLDPGMHERIERVFERLPPGATVLRANALAYNNPALHQPLAEGERKAFSAARPVYVRVERQTLTRLPASKWILFAIHTQVVPETYLNQHDLGALAAFLAGIGHAGHGGGTGG